VAVAALGVVAAACGPTPGAAPPPSTTPHGVTGQGPVIAGFVCPVNGSVYSDSFGPRGTGWHYGIDMMVPIGRTVRAVKGGRVHYVPNEGAGGNAVYLAAGDGNTYYYAHLNDYVGGDRTVAKGQTIGHSGMTGNATGPHLHFEIRVGGANGTRVDPYNTLRAYRC